MDLSAVAAFAAAGISLATLGVTTVVSGTREQVRWSRDSLTEAFVTLVDASWRTTDAVKRRVTLEAAGAPAPDLQAQHEVAVAGYREMRTQLTRVRLLASERVTAAGVELIRRHAELRDAAPADVPARLIAVSSARKELIAVAKRELRLR